MREAMDLGLEVITHTQIDKQNSDRTKHMFINTQHV